MDLENKIYVELKQGLKRNELVLYYQPQIDIQTGIIIGVEALVRWNHPSEGMLTPGYFIAIAEENDLINLIGDWVILEGISQIKKWLLQGMPISSMSINLSPIQLQNKKTSEEILKVLDEVGLDPSILDLELTESILMHDAEDVNQIIKKLNQKGVTFSIDDFGTGYSSFAYLKKFDVQRIKIDQSFIKELNHSAEDKKIVQSIINLANELNLGTIAEGVEDEATLMKLKNMGCTQAQGYLIGKPMSAKDFETYFSKKLKIKESS
jgi:EAL domain-containing protein (putative c-di-GMP-specific phosphodiesterase class I)